MDFTTETDGCSSTFFKDLSPKPMLDEQENIGEDPDGERLSHAELKDVFQKALEPLLKNDPILSDLHPQVTLEEVSALIEVEHGRAVTVFIEKVDGGHWSVVVPREATVLDLKRALKNHVALSLSRRNIKKKISWRYIWKNNILCYNSVQLSDLSAHILDYGINNKSTLTFSK
ncbi:unnamed protein product, partial [Meganyctiphanes norvegica]